MNQWFCDLKWKLDLYTRLTCMGINMGIKVLPLCEHYYSEIKTLSNIWNWCKCFRRKWDVFIHNGRILWPHLWNSRLKFEFSLSKIITGYKADNFRNIAWITSRVYRRFLVDLTKATSFDNKKGLPVRFLSWFRKSSAEHARMFDPRR